MAKVSIPTINSGYESVTRLNENFQDLEDELNDKVLYRVNPSGEPNQMENDLDMNGHRILNILSTTGGDNFIWMGAWVAETNYSINNLVYFDGSTYICVTDHTSDATDFAEDLALGYWEEFAIKGAAGAGTGDMLAANALSELVDVKTTARNNINAARKGWNNDITALAGLTTPIPVTSGGTGVTALTDGYALIGNGTSDVELLAPGASGNVMTSNGSSWVSAAATGVFSSLEGPVLSSKFDSYASDKTVSLAHGLGVIPKGFSIRLRCISADINYSVNDEIDITSLMTGTQTGTVWCNSTYIGLTTTNVFSSSITAYLPNKTTGAIGSATASKWKLVIYAWA